MPQPPQTPPTQPLDPTPPPPPPAGPSDPPSVADLVFEVSQRASFLVREEIELAKAEVSEKVAKLLRGSVVGLVAGAFAFLALILIMHGVAWLLAEEVFGGNVWAGFLIEAAIFLLVAAGAGFFAYRSLQAGAPPVPAQAIEEAKLTKEMLTKDDTAPAAPSPTPAQAPPLQGQGPK